MSFPKYPQYKESGDEWFGLIPQHWKLLRFQRCVYVAEGQVDPEDSRYSNMILIAPNHIESRTGRLLQLETAADQGAESGKYYCEALDVVYSKIRPALRKVCIAPESCLCSADMYPLRPHSGLTNRFLFWLILSEEFSTFAELESQRVAMPKINRDSLNAVSIALPPTIEQVAIANFLDRETQKVDDLVAEQQRLIELLKEKRLAVISHAVTKGLNPNAPMKPSGIEWLGDVPEHWETIKLGRVVFMQEGPGLRTWQFTDDGTRVICVTNITEDGIDFSRLEKFISTEEYISSYSHFTVDAGDVLLSSSGNSWGKVATYDGNEKVILNTSTIRLNETDASPLTRECLVMLLQSVLVREQLMLAMTGSCQPNFGPTHLSRVIVAIPPKQEQLEIVEYGKVETNKLDSLITEATNAIELLLERRSAVISAAVTGKIDVRGLVPTEAA